MSLVSTPTWRPQCRHPAGGGQGSRYAAQRPGADKLLASLQGPCVAVASARRLRAAVDSVVAVVRPGNAALAALLRRKIAGLSRRIRRARAWGPAWRRRRGIAGLPGTRAVLVALADMPWIRHASMAGVLDALQHAPMAAPSHRGQRGHPVGFRADLLPRLALLSADEGARRLLGQPGLRLVEVEDPGVLLDIDTPADLDRAG